MQIISIIIIALSIWGIGLTIHINKKKKVKKPLVCMMGAHCEDVVRSKFSSFFGIGLEFFGGLYYGVILISYSLLLFLPQLFNDFIIFILTGLTIAAFLFSIYLTFVQAFFIKRWCSWCLCSAGISTTIFILAIIALLNSSFEIIPILEFLYTPIVMLHLVGFALGVGGATVSDILFLKFLKDFKIDVRENKVLKIMSQIIWFGLLLIIISGIGLYLPRAEELLQSSKFLLKMVVVAVIVVNGALLNLLVSPRLMQISIDYMDPEKPTVLRVGQVNSFRKFSFALGAISFGSWYTALILGVLDRIPLPFIQLLGIYIGIIIILVIGSQIFERLYTHQKKKV